ncbi:MAG: hypothetical protein U0939_19185 [Pirellulales bacterium]
MLVVRLARIALTLALLGFVAHGPAESRLRAADGPPNLDYPLAVASAAEGPIYLADRNLPGVWKLEGEKLSLHFQASKKFRTPLNAVRCLALDAQGKLLAGDSATRDVYRFDDQNQPVPLTKGAIGIPMSIATAKNGDLIVADLELHVIWRVPAAGGTPSKVAAVPAPRGVAVDSEDRIWVVSHGKDQIVRLDAEGKPETIVAGQPFQFAHQIVINEKGTAFVSDGYSKAVWKIEPGAEPQKWVAGEPLVNPVGLALRGALVLVVDPRAKTVFQIDESGKIAPLPAQP